MYKGMGNMLCSFSGLALGEVKRNWWDCLKTSETHTIWFQKRYHTYCIVNCSGSKTIFILNEASYDNNRFILKVFINQKRYIYNTHTYIIIKQMIELCNRFK